MCDLQFEFKKTTTCIFMLMTNRSTSTTLTAITTYSHSIIKIPFFFLLLCSLLVDSETDILFIFI